MRPAKRCTQPYPRNADEILRKLLLAHRTKSLRQILAIAQDRHLRASRSKLGRLSIVLRERPHRKRMSTRERLEATAKAAVQQIVGKCQLTTGFSTVITFRAVLGHRLLGRKTARLHVVVIFDFPLDTVTVHVERLRKGDAAPGLKLKLIAFADAQILAGHPVTRFNCFTSGRTRLRLKELVMAGGGVFAVAARQGSWWDARVSKKANLSRGPLMRSLRRFARAALAGIVGGLTNPGQRTWKYVIDWLGPALAKPLGAALAKPTDAESLNEGVKDARGRDAGGSKQAAAMITPGQTGSKRLPRSRAGSNFADNSRFPPS